jgi:FtsH-binding integral membrane protein
MNYEPDYDTETDFIKRVEKDFEKTQRSAVAMARLNTITDGISSICIIILIVLGSYKGIYFLSEKMNQAYDGGETAWYFIYTCSLILCISLFFKLILKAAQGTNEQE